MIKISLFSVFSFGTLSINEGDPITVIGTFKKAIKVGPSTIYNQIEAEKVFKIVK